MNHLLWTECGPDLEAVCGENLPAWLREYGETRVRYVAHLAAGLPLPEEEHELRDLIARGLYENWLSPTTLQAILASTHRRPGLPFLSRYLPTSTAGQREKLIFLSGLCEGGQKPLEGRMASGEGLVTDDRELVSLIASGLCQVEYTIHPDLRIDNVVRWLAFVVNGAADPMLKSAFMRYRPDRHVPNYSACVSAWSALLDDNRSQ